MTDATLKTNIRQAREATVRAHADAENRHDPDATVATFSDAKASYDIPAFGDAGQVPNHDAIRELFVGMFSVFPDFHIEAGPLRHGDDHVFVEFLFTGTQHADWAGIPSTGRSFSTRVAVLFEFEQDQLVCERCYLDFGDIARQLVTG
ncbi:MAG: ester cyclase [Pseudonocardiaceae bacterium]